MRMHQTAPLLLPHRAEQDVEIQGYTIPKHTRIWVNAWSISRDATYWEKPTCFMPERFLNVDIDFRGNDFRFTPFSAGRRICPGMNLAVRMVALIVVNLIKTFDWKLPNGMAPEDMDMTEKFGVTLRKAEPLVAIPVRSTT
ncbi:UNVERIFIED_CONTAM: cytochrome [Sesamum radiatum]|uniref:Cytochrome n=1 Tax=Sesamum radiatum TaxID=300843 RepID=A0AAW2TYU7_SESRA